MKFLLMIILMVGLAFCACLFLPWWSIAPAVFLVAVFSDHKPPAAFLGGFLALFFLWGGLSWWMSSANDHLLAGKMSIIILQSNQPYMLILLTALIGGIVAAFAALSGSMLRLIILKK